MAGAEPADEAASLRSRLAWMTRERDRLAAEVERLTARADAAAATIHELRNRLNDEAIRVRLARSFPEPAEGGNR